NAYFTGLFRQKRIVLFDTLLEAMGPREVVAVLAHELGHFKLHHVRWALVRGLLSTGLIFYLLGRALPLTPFYPGFGLAPPSSAAPRAAARDGRGLAFRRDGGQQLGVGPADGQAPEALRAVGGAVEPEQEEGGGRPQQQHEPPESPLAQARVKGEEEHGVDREGQAPGGLVDAQVAAAGGGGGP